MQLHKRFFPVQQARNEFKQVCWDFQKQHQLTDVEMFGAILDMLEYFHRGWLRFERHGDEDKKADEA